MKRDLVEILACPVCKSPLNLTVLEQSEVEVIRARSTAAAARSSTPLRTPSPTCCRRTFAPRVSHRGTERPTSQQSPSPERPLATR